MATLVLTAAGTLLGGPLGGALGAVIGQSLDRNLLFAPRARQGPRLGDLSIQTSSYGSQIPRIFGTMRAAGTVIWATDLTEHRATSGGKGQPKVTSYSYSASFAVALSARSVSSVGRIWADGKLLRGSAGDLKSPVSFRLHQGDEDQGPDPLVAALEGKAQTPAYRGIAYAVFEEMGLEDFGNRIPSLTFEIVADSAPVPIGAIAEALAHGVVDAGETPALSGYAAAGDSLRAALEGLADVVPLSLADDGARQQLRAGAGDPVFMPLTAMTERLEIVRRGQGSVPGEASITYYDAARDYQAGLQRAMQGDGRSADQRALPAVLDAAAAKALAHYRLASLRAGRVTAKAMFGWRQGEVRAGSHVRIEGEAGLWRVTRWTLGSMTVTLDLVRVPTGAAPAAVASPGRAIGEADVPIGATIIHVLDLPLGDGSETKPRVHVAAAGENAGWRRAALSASFDGGTSWQDLGSTAAPAVIGRTLGTLAPAGSALFDAVSTFDVELAHGAMWLEGRNDDALAAGANLAAVGAELIQFGAVEALGGPRFRLSRLLRGRRGTEWAAVGHTAEEPFTLIVPDALLPVEAPTGVVARLLASGPGDLPEPALASRLVEGETLRPPSPVHLRATELPSGDLLISWVRRSRLGWGWSDAADTPLGEEAELYRLTIAGAAFTRTIETDRPDHVYAAAERSADGPGPVILTVVQAGSFASSRPASLSLA